MVKTTEVDFAPKLGYIGRKEKLMAEEKKEFVWKYESVLDHGITPEEFEHVTGFKWANRMEYLEAVVTSEYAGCYDIDAFYGSCRHNPEKASYYSKLSVLAPMDVDYCF